MPILSVENVSKKFCKNLRKSLFYGIQDILTEFSFRRSPTSDKSLRQDEFWSLNNVSFELNKGDSLAIIGDNGAGKSTLLKLIYGLIRPDTGRIVLRGKIGAMIELEAGLDQALTGRENIYNKATLLGYSKKHIDSLIDEIIEFAGVEDFIDAPIQFYSSGMASRLAFSVTAHLKPNVLLVDEVLAVGDIDFQRKCINFMLDYLSSGGAIILVSHSPYHIQSVCNRGLILEHGRVAFNGKSTDALDRYFESGYQKQSESNNLEERILDEEHPILIEKVEIESVTEPEITTGKDCKITVNYKSIKTIDNVAWVFNIWTHDNLVCVTGNGDINPRILNEGDGTLSCIIPQFPIFAGVYLLKIAIVELASFYPLATKGWVDSPIEFKVSTAPNLLNNSFKSFNQLMTINADWNN